MHSALTSVRVRLGHDSTGATVARSVHIRASAVDGSDGEGGCESAPALGLHWLPPTPA